MEKDYITAGSFNSRFLTPGGRPMAYDSKRSTEFLESATALVSQYKSLESLVDRILGDIKLAMRTGKLTGDYWDDKLTVWEDEFKRVKGEITKPHV